MCQVIPFQRKKTFPTGHIQEHFKSCRDLNRSRWIVLYVRGNILSHIKESDYSQSSRDGVGESRRRRTNEDRLYID